MPAVDSRPTPAAQPKPDARALVGNTSEAKICIELPATWMKNTMTKPEISNCVGLPALANTIAMMPAPMKAQTDGDFAAVFIERVHHEDAGARHREVHAQDERERLGDA